MRIDTRCGFEDGDVRREDCLERNSAYESTSLLPTAHAHKFFTLPLG
jgi:hypothetical protein